MKHMLLSTATLAAFVLLGERASGASSTSRTAAEAPGAANTVGAQAGTEAAPGQAVSAYQQRSGTRVTTRPMAAAGTPYGWYGAPPNRQGRTLVIKSSAVGRTNLAEIEEDLSIMARILDKALDEDTRAALTTRYGIVATSLAKDQLPILYLEGYGAVFFLGTQVPLVPPPAREAAKPKPAASATWEATRQELYGRKGPPGAPTYWGAAAPVEYDDKLVEQLKAKLLHALKEGAHLRHVKPDEFITVVVLGPAATATDRATTVAEEQPAAEQADAESAPAQYAEAVADPTAASTGGGGGFGGYGAGYGGGGGGFGMGGYGMGGGASTGEPWFSYFSLQSGRIGTTLIIRVKKANADAYAAEKLSAQEFQAKAMLNAYIGNTGGEALSRSGVSRY